MYDIWTSTVCIPWFFFGKYEQDKRFSIPYFTLQISLMYNIFYPLVFLETKNPNGFCNVPNISNNHSAQHLSPILFPWGVSSNDPQMNSFSQNPQNPAAWAQNHHGKGFLISNRRDQCCVTPLPPHAHHSLYSSLYRV